MSKTNLVIISLLIILIIIALFSLFYFFSNTAEEKINEAKETKEFEEFSDYSNDKWEFSINYPVGWSQNVFTDDDLGFAIDFNAPIEEENQTSLENIFVEVFLAEGDDFETITLEIIDELTKEFDLASQEKIEFNGLVVDALEYSSSDYISSVNYLYYFIDGGEYWYQLTYVAEANQYNKNIDLVKKSLKSFKILNI